MIGTNTSLLFLAVFLLVVDYTLQWDKESINLAGARDLWFGKGPAFKYQKTIKLMSERIVDKTSMFGTKRAINGGNNWVLNFTYIVKGDDKLHGEGFAIWLSKVNPYKELQLFVKDQLKPKALGFQGRFSGVGIGAVINSTKKETKNQYVSAKYTIEDVTPEEFLLNTKVCRRNIFRDKTNFISLQYKKGHLSFYTKENDRLVLCNSFTIDLKSFYIVLTAQGQEKHSLSIDIHKIVYLGTDKNFKTNYGSGEYHHFDSIPHGDVFENFHRFKKEEEIRIEAYKNKFKSILENNNKKLLSTMYKNEKESYQELSDVMHKVAKMTASLRSLMTNVDKTINNSKNKLASNLNKIHNWLNSMEDIYDSMENEIDLITKRVTAVKLGDRLKIIDQKLTGLSSKLIDLDFSSTNLFQKGGEVVKFLEKLNSLTGKLSTKSQFIRSDLSSKINKSLKKQRNFGFISSSVMIILAIGIFAFILMKLNKLIEKAKGVW